MLGVLVLVAVALAACSGSSHHDASTTTTQAGPNPDVVPSVITPAYVDAVFKVLNHINGNAVRSLLAARSVTSDAKADLRAIFADPLYATELSVAQQTVQQDSKNVRHPPGDRITTVVTLSSASARCIFAQTTTSLAQVLVKPPAPAPAEFYGLKQKQPSDDPKNLNPTPWAIYLNVTFLTPTSIPNQCGS